MNSLLRWLGQGEGLRENGPCPHTGFISDEWPSLFSFGSDHWPPAGLLSSTLPPPPKAMHGIAKGLILSEWKDKVLMFISREALSYL